MKRKTRIMPLPVLAVSLLPALAHAGEADVIDASASQGSDGTWTITATLRHGDEGWDHYADRWEVLGPDGTVLGTRELAHPHVDEQPFTRSLGGIVIPESVDSVTLRAGDSVHGFGGAVFTLELPR